MKRRLSVTLPAFLLLMLALPVAAQARAAEPLPSLDDKVIFGGTFTLASGQTLDGDLLSFGGEVILEVDSTLNGDVLSMGGSVDAAGLITGDLIAMGSHIELRETAEVRGDLALLGSNVDRAPGAQVHGDAITDTLTFDLPEIEAWPGLTDTFEFTPPANGFDFGNGRRLGDDVIGGLFRAFALSAFAVLLVLFLPDQTRRVADTTLAEPVASAGLALVTLVAIPILAVFMAITIILIPVVLLMGLVLFLAVVYGWVAIGQEVGERLVEAMKVDWPPAIQAGVGTFTLTFTVALVGMVPCIGWLAGFLVTLLGLGAVLLTRFGTQPYPQVMEAAPAKKPPTKKKSG